MATFIQRGQAIGNALINGTATAAQLNRLGRALAHNMARASEYDAATSDGKAQIFVEAFRKFCIDSLKDAESAQAATTAVQQAAALIETDFPQAP